MQSPCCDLLLEFSSFSGSKRVANGGWDKPLKTGLELVRKHSKVFEFDKLCSELNMVRNIRGISEYDGR